MIFKYRCSECGKTQELGAEFMLCPLCSEKGTIDEPLRGILDVEIQGSLPTDWQSHQLLPVDPKYLPAIPVGNTPLWKPPRLAKTTGHQQLYVKDDTTNPTGSYKDRASYLVAALATQWGVQEISLASSGNAGSSMAGIGAASGIDVTLFLPARAPKPKLVQALQYGARVIRVDGNYDDAFELSMEYVKTRGGMSRNTAYNPLTIEGKKTAALEIFQQLGSMPQHVFVSAGDCVILCGLYKGFTDLVRLGLASAVPTLHAVQASGSRALHRAIQQGHFTRQPTTSVADSICMDVPRAGYRALTYLEKYDGHCLLVSDEQILSAQRRLSREAGLFAEPSGAMALAGFLATSIPRSQSSVLVVTGHGLKDVEAASSLVEIPQQTVRSLDDLEHTK